MRTTIRVWVSGIAATTIAVAAAGCTGGSDAAPLTTVAPTAPATDDAPPATEATTTTTTTTTTSPPPTTVDGNAIKADVEAGLRAYSAAYENAYYDLDDPDTREGVIDRSVDGGDSVARAIVNFDEYLADGQRVRPNPEIPNRIDVFEIQLVDDTTAVVDYCRIDSDIVFEPDGLGEGVELIVNDDVFVDRVETTMKLDDGTWKVLEGQRIERFEGAMACPEN